MKVFAYSYCDPLLGESAEDWGQEVERAYCDLAGRQQWEQLLADCQISAPDRLLIRRWEDLGDSVPAVCDRLAQLETLGIEVAIAGVPLASIRRDLLQLFPTLQRSLSARRIQQGHARNRVKALPPPGKAPYGYRRGKDRYAIDRAAAAIVKDFCERFILFGSLRGAVRYIEKKYGKKISASTGQRWLISPVYRGDTAYKNGDIIPNTHAPILSREEAAQIDRLLRRNRQLAPRSASAPRSLSGLVTCARCSSSMTVTSVSIRRSSQTYLYLRPLRCPWQPKCRALAYEEVLQQAIAKICQALPQAVAQIQAPNPEGIKNRLIGEINRQQEILAQLPSLISSGILDAETAQLRAYKLQAEIAQIQAQIAQLPPPNLAAIAQAVSIPRFWLDLSESERRFYFREFIRQIEILRGDNNWEIKIIFIFDS